MLGGLNNENVVELGDAVALSSRLDPNVHKPQPIVGIGLDCCVLPLRHGDLRLVQTTDFFFPLIDDPFIMGRIACCNVLSDLYAMGVVECDNMLMLLGVSTKLEPQEAKICVNLLIQGFQQVAKEAGTSIQGGQTVRNPWLLIGGVATSICREVEYILPNGAEVGDVLVLTKPLGTQVAVNAYKWMKDAKALAETTESTDNSQQQHPQWSRTSVVLSEADAIRAYDLASRHMSRLNKNAAMLMHKYKAHGATDVTGFGIVGHAENLIECQKENLNFIIHNLPLLPKMNEVDDANACMFKLMQGRSAETSGGLLVILPSQAAPLYCQELKELDGYSAWIIGSVESAQSSETIIDNQQQPVKNQVILHKNLRVTYD